MALGIRAQAASIKDALEDEGLTVYAGLAPDSATGRYAVIYPARRFGGDRRFGGGPPASRGLRITVLVVGASANEAWWVEEKVEAALDGRRVQIDDAVCTPSRFESSRAVGVDPDDSSVFSGTTVWTYAARAA